MGRPKLEEETIYLAGKVNYKGPCYRFVKEKLTKVTKTELLLEALNALQAIESGEIYARYFTQVLQQLKMQPPALNDPAIQQPSIPEPKSQAVIEEKPPAPVQFDLANQTEEIVSEKTLDNYSEDELDELMKILQSNGR